MSAHDLQTSRGLWNRSTNELRSNEVLAQILDRGDIGDWRALYRLAVDDGQLRARILEIVRTVPLPYPHLWLAAFAALGDKVDLNDAVPNDTEVSI